MSQAFQTINTDVGHTALQLGDVGAVKVSKLGRFLLAESMLVSQAFQVL